MPISVKDMTSTERRKVMGALMFLTEKRDKSVKGRMVYNGKPTREWLTREDSASPTAALESIMLTAVIDAHEGRDIMCADIPNAFIQAEMPDISDGKERVTNEDYRSASGYAGTTKSRNLRTICCV